MDRVFKTIASLAKHSQGNKLIVLTYHRVFSKPDEMYPNEVDVAKFTWQMDLLRRYFNVLSLADSLTHLKLGTLPPRTVCLSFDDGYESCYTQVLPILQKFGFSACFFIVSKALSQRVMWNDWIVETVRSVSADVLDLGHLGLGSYSLDDRAGVAQKLVATVKYLPFRERTSLCEKIGQLSETTMPLLMLTTDQLRQMHEQGMEIGGHTVNHPILKTLTLPEAEREIGQNKEELEQILQAPVRFFAYPNGKLGRDYLPEHAKLVKNCGYEAALTTDWGCIDRKADLWRLPRFTPWDNSRLRFMLRMVRGYFS